MCFSAQISFLAAGLLLSIAIYTLKKASSAREVPFGLIPFIFSLQQAAEGVLWLILPASSYPVLTHMAKYIFIISAIIIWPVMMPYALSRIENNRTRQTIMKGCLLIGSCWSLGALWYLSRGGVSVSIEGCHISYSLPGFDYFSPSSELMLIIYCISTLLPLLVATRNDIKVLGCLIGLSCMVSYFFYYGYFISVWCFFAAVISISVLFITRRASLSH